MPEPLQVDETEQQLEIRIAHKLNVKKSQVEQVIGLLDEGNTVPFITRYRKHQTGGLDETAIRQIGHLIEELREVTAQRERMLRAIQEQGKLTPQLKAEFDQAETKKRLDELYSPFKSRRKTRADEAHARGLSPLAEAIWTGRVGDSDLQRVAANCVGKHKDLTSADIVMEGAKDILAAKIAESLPIRDAVRELARQSGRITTKLVKNSDDAQLFQDYAAFEGSLKKLPPHRVLAINRGESRKALRVKMSWDQDLAVRRSAGIQNWGKHACRSYLMTCLSESLQRLINPSVEREIRRDLTEQAQQHAIEVFSRNLQSLLMQPPLQRKRVLAIDPGFRSGCKVAVLDENGNLQHNDLVFVTGSSAELQQQKLADLVQKYEIEIVAIGNGTASRETEELVADTIRQHNLTCRYTIVNEAGASIYSASEIGREEFPDHDATVRGTISIGRRLQDPLSELVKIDPQHIGVGMYQHDIAEKELATSLDVIVESCVNNVGVDLNRSSAELLKYVSGLNRNLARKIVQWRSQHGPFRNREQLMQVSGVGEMTFTQAAGFLRIPDGDEPLDGTWIHPESYPLARSIINNFCKQGEPDTVNSLSTDARKRLEGLTPDVLAGEIKTDPFTAQELLQSLLKPIRDPRRDVSGPLFRSGVLTFEDLREGMQLQGVVGNVVDFGAFVDIGLKNDGLIHISKMADTFVSSPFDHVNVGDVVTVWIDNLDQNRKRVGLSLLRPDRNN